MEYHTMRTRKYLVCAPFLTLVCFLLSTFSLQAKETVVVGLYHFPPFIVNDGEQVGGLAPEMLEIMNAEQNEFEFVAIAISPVTRHQILELGRVDMSMFEQPEWGWQGSDIDMSEVFLDGAEVYIALAEQGRDQNYFRDFSDKRMIGVRGYHYGFAGFNSDPEFLEEKFKMQLTPSNLGSIKMVLDGNRGDVAVVTRSFLAQYLRQYPEHRERLLISNKLDQRYQLRIALRKGIGLTVEKLNALLKSLEEQGKFEKLWNQIINDL